ncbi:MAG: hypothetical protein DWQ34_26915 [Planctomycetota bacterium]|nr:MAG: hypothetical protein DWQ29_13480 [Planctomycetota bacterium]REJ86609.1 MAG: hypothetical protein DWQ34_26915 [Planctomycetota bacterium]REK28472.1 MAG: hypothetical protein DWQ41_05855 [Planctomycetota bacterium]REK29109.1 MAG: hypothetical protein DWQ45_23480 [Planctomycetota bacterium]
MKGLLVAVIVVLLAALFGWLSFSTSPDRATMNVELQEIQEDTQGLVHATEELAEQTAEGVEKVGEEIDEHIDVDIQDDAPEREIEIESSR